MEGPQGTVTEHLSARGQRAVLPPRRHSAHRVKVPENGMLTGDLTIACAECRSSRSLPWRKIIHSPFKDDTLYQFGAGCSGMRIMIKLVRTGFLADVIAMGEPLATTEPAQARSEARRVGNACVSTGRSRW